MEMKVFDEDNIQGRLHTVYFRVGGQVFCDSIATYPEEKQINSYCGWQARALHTVSKIELTNDVLTIRPLDLDWTNQHKSELPHLMRAEDKDWPLFTASTAQWQTFLKKYGSDTNAFPDKHEFVLQKQHAK
jgi:hypothetical protein